MYFMVFTMEMKLSVCLSLLFSSIQVSVSQNSVCRPTSPDTEGPYYHPGAPVKNTTVCDDTTNAVVLVVSGRVTDDSCKGLESFMDVWQADTKGDYSDGISDFKCRTRIFTDTQGYYKYTTIYPARYKQFGSYRPAHIHYKVEPIVGGFGTFITQLYFKNDTYLAPRDSCGTSCNSGDPTRQVDLKVGEDWYTLEATFNIVIRKTWIP